MSYRFNKQLGIGKLGERKFEHMMATQGRRVFKTHPEIDRHYKYDYEELTEDWPYEDGPQRWEVKYDVRAASSGRLFFETYSVFNHVDGPEKEVVGWANYGGSAANSICMIVPFKPVEHAYIFDMPTLHSMFAPGGAWANQKEIEIENENERGDIIYYSKGVPIEIEIVTPLIVAVYDVPTLGGNPIRTSAPN